MEIVKNESLLRHYIKAFHLDDRFSGDMAKLMTFYSFEKGELVCSIDEELKFFYFIVKGKLKIYTILENGKSVLVRFYFPASVIGDLEMFKNYKVRCNVEAITKTLAIGIKMEDIREYAANDHIFLKFVIENLSHKLYTLSNMTALNQSYPFINRFASYLITIACDDNNKLISEIKTSNMTELATFLGVSYRHLNRVIKNLCVRGLIKRTREGLKILDYEKLKEMSGGYYE